MSRSRSLLAASIAALSLFITTAAHAAPGNMQLSWSGCTAGPLRDLTVTPGEHSGVNLYCFLTGQTDPTTAYQVQILYGDANNLVPDAWRFDPAGCQGAAHVVLNHLAPAAVSKSCPSFQAAGGTVTQSIQIKDVSFSPPALPYPTTLMRISVADLFGGVGNLPVAGQTYFLMDAEFDHSMSTSGPSVNGCGNLADPICFHLLSGSYLIDDGSGQEISFLFGGPSSYVTANAPGGSCFVTPAHPATWGSIKAQYRN